MIFRITPSIALELTSESVSYDIDTLFLYRYGSAYGNEQQLMFPDGHRHARSRSYWISSGNFSTQTVPSNIIIDRLGANFHTNADVSNLITSLSSNLRFSKWRLLFASGFGYDSDTLGLAITVSSNKFRLVNLIDEQTSSNIVPCNEVVFDTQVFNSCLPLEVLDLPYLFNSELSDIQELKTLIFGSSTAAPVTVSVSEITTSDKIEVVEGSNTFTKYLTNYQTVIVSGYQTYSDIVVRHSIDRDKLLFTILHEQFDLNGWLTVNGHVASSISYDITMQEFNSSDVLLNTLSFRYQNILSPLATNVYRYPSVLSSTAYVLYTIVARIVTETGLVISAQGDGVFANANVFRYSDIPSLSIDNINANIIRSNDVIEVIQQRESPAVVIVDRPVFVTATASAAIQVYPLTFTTRLSNIPNGLTNVRLKIGELYFDMLSNDYGSFTIDGTLISKTITAWYLVNENNEMIQTGNVQFIN